MYELICKESIRFAVAHGRHNFRKHIDEAKSFVSLLLHNGYVPFPRKQMYWETVDDTQNILERNTISRNKFHSIMQNLHLANYNNLDASNKFAKVRMLITLLNEACILCFFYYCLALGK